MLSDEEKKAIEYWKTHMEILHWNTQLASEHYIKVLLDLIEKQYKEIEELKMITKEYDSFLGNEKIIIADKSYFDDGYFKEKFISKDKIKAKIEEIQQRRENDGECELALHGFQREAKIEVLQSLLEKE